MINALQVAENALHVLGNWLEETGQDMQYTQHPDFGPNDITLKGIIETALKSIKAEGKSGAAQDDETVYTVVICSNENKTDSAEVIDAFSWRSSECYEEVRAEWANHEELKPFFFTQERFHELIARNERLDIVGDNITITVVAATQPQVISLQGFFTNQITN